MKKIFYIFAAATMLLASCSSDDNTSIETPNVPVQTLSKKNLKLNINIANPEDNDLTRAFVKNGWVNGDILKIWFDGSTGNATSNPDLVIKYDGRVWNVDKEAEVSDNMPLETGTMKVVYDGDVKFSTNKEYTYSTADQSLSAKLNDWLYMTEIQVVVTGISDASNYTLSCDHLTAFDSYTVSVDAVTASVMAVDSPVDGISNADGVAFVFAASDKYDKEYNYEFTLTRKSDNSKSYYVGTKKTIKQDKSKLIGLKLSSANFLNYKYVAIGKKKWATMNLGATTVAGSPATSYGDYYAWGETEPRYSSLSWSDGSPSITWKDSYSTDKYQGISNSTFNDAATKQWGNNWHVPSTADFKALIEDCGGEVDTDGKFVTTVIKKGSTVNATNENGIYCISNDQEIFTDYQGVSGLLFVHKVNDDFSVQLFLPASGNISDKFNNTGFQYWSKEAFNYANGYYLNGSFTNTTTSGGLFQQSSTTTNLTLKYNDRGVKYRGYTIRPVHD